MTEMEVYVDEAFDDDMVTNLEVKMETVDISLSIKPDSPDSTSVLGSTTNPSGNGPQPLLPPCRVCGEKASGFHYGANTCEACKGFFRRSIVKVQQNKEEYKCQGGNNDCSIKAGKRSACPWCRYKKCLDVGMSQNAIKTGRYTYEKRTKDTQEVKKLLKKDVISDIEVSESEAKSIVDSMLEIQNRCCPLQLTSEQKVEFIRQKQQDVYEQYKVKQEIFGRMAAIPLDVYNEFYSVTGMELDDRGELMQKCTEQMEKGLQNMVDIVRVIPGFCELPVEDQTNLIKVSHFEFWFLIQQRLINTDLEVMVGNGEGYHKNDILRIFGKPEYVDQVLYYAKSLHALKLTEEEIVILRGIVVTFRDRCQLKKPEVVEAIQWKLLNCLRWLAKVNGHNPDTRMCRILDRLTALRTLTEENYKINKIKATWPAMQEHPLLLDLLSGNND